jgi:hypothetical protein
MKVGFSDAPQTIVNLAAQAARAFLRLWLEYSFQPRMARRITPTTVKDPINDLAEVERWSSDASEDEDVTAELVGSGDD